MFYVYSDGRREQTETTLEHCLNSVRSGSYVELDDMTPRPSPVRVQATPTATRQDDEIRVGDVVEVVSCRSTGWTTVTDVGTRGRVTEIDESVGIVRLESHRGQRLPQEGIAGLADVRKVTSPSPSSPQTVTVNFSPMPDGEVAKLATTVSEIVREIIDNPSPPTEARASINFVDVVAVPAAEAYRRLATDDRRLSNAQQPSSRPAPQPSSPPAPPPPPSRFSLLEVDVKNVASPAPPQAVQRTSASKWSTSSWRPTVKPFPSHGLHLTWWAVVELI